MSKETFWLPIESKGEFKARIYATFADAVKVSFRSTKRRGNKIVSTPGHVYALLTVQNCDTLQMECDVYNALNTIPEVN